MKRNPVLKAFAMTALALSMFASCSKKDGVIPPKPPEPPITGVTQQAVTKISFKNLVNGSPTTILTQYRTTPLQSYDISASGEYKAEYHAKNGRPMLESDPRNASTMTNLAVFNMPVGDTLVILKKNGSGLYAKVTNYVTEIEDNVNDGINYSILAGQTAAQVRANGNTFADPSNANAGSLKALTLKQQ